MYSVIHKLTVFRYDLIGVDIIRVWNNFRWCLFIWKPGNSPRA